MRIRSFRWIFLFCAAALLLTLYVHIAPAIWYNARLRKNFIPNPETALAPIANPVSFQEFHRRALSACSDAFVPVYERSLQNFQLKLSKSISLYAEPTRFADNALLEQGKSLDLQANCIWDDTRGYGIFGLPSTKHGWRCWPAGFGFEDSLVPGQYTLPFVKTEDLIDLAATLYDRLMEYPFTPMSQSLQESVNRLGLSKEEYCRYMVLTTDRYMYENGIYLSPDLLMQVWDTPAALLLSGSALSLAGFLLVTFRRRNRRFPDTPSKNDLT